MGQVDQRGATAVEMATIGLLLFGLIFGIIELGLAFRTRHTVTSATNAGVRAVSVGTNDVEADFAAVQAIAEALDVTGVDITRVIVYRADTPDAAPSAGCQAGNPSNGIQPCNVYTPADLSAGVAAFGCGPSSPDRHWCPTSRNASTGSLELVGVTVIADHDFVTGFLGDGFTFTSTAVLPVEPAGTT